MCDGTVLAAQQMRCSRLRRKRPRPCCSPPDRSNAAGIPNRRTRLRRDHGRRPGLAGPASPGWRSKGLAGPVGSGSMGSNHDGRRSAPCQARIGAPGEAPSPRSDESFGIRHRTARGFLERAEAVRDALRDSRSLGKRQGSNPSAAPGAGTGGLNRRRAADPCGIADPARPSCGGS